MEVREAGIVSVPVSPLQLPKAPFLMEMMELGMFNVPTKPLQPLKAFSPIEVMELGMMEFLQPEINSLVLVLMMALQLSLES